MNDNYYHSLSAGTTLLALDAYASATQGAARNLSLAEVLKDKRVRTLELAGGHVPEDAFSEQAAALRFINNSDLNAYYTIEQSGFDRKPPTEAIRQGFEVLREYTDASGKPLTSIGMGQQVDVRLKFRGIGRDYVSSMALVDLLPGGFELVVPSQEAQTPFLEASTDASEGEGYGEESTFTGWHVPAVRRQNEGEAAVRRHARGSRRVLRRREQGHVGDRLSHQGDERGQLRRAAGLRRGDVRPQRRRTLGGRQAGGVAAVSDGESQRRLFAVCSSSRRRR